MESNDPHDREHEDDGPDTPETPPDQPPPPHVQDPPPDQGTPGPYIVTANSSLNMEG
jgi:hypothetical protein